MKLIPILPILVACCFVRDSKSQQIETIAGSGFAGFRDGIRGSAMFNFPTAIVLDSLNNVFVADTRNGKIRKITDNGEVTTIRGSRDSRSFQVVQNPTGIAIDGRGTIFFSGNGAISSVAEVNNPALDNVWAGGLRPRDIVYQSNESLLIADPQAKKVLRVSLTSAGDGVPEDYAGSGNEGSADGTGALASFSFPRALASDASGNIYVSDGNRIRKVGPDRNVSTFSGSVEGGFQDGDSASARFNEPSGLAVSPTGTVYVADTGNNVIRRIRPTGAVTTLVGSDSNPFVLRRPTDIAIDSHGNLVICDSFSHQIRRIVFNPQPDVPLVEVAVALYPGLTIKGKLGQVYLILSSDSVRSGTWKLVGSIKLTEGQKIWHDDRPPNGPRFYRAVLQE